MPEKIRVEVDPLAAKFMQKEIRWDRAELCQCKIANPAEECYSNGIFYIIDTPEESGTLAGYATAYVHHGCGKPVLFTAEQMRALPPMLSKWEFFNK